MTRDAVLVLTAVVAWCIAAHFAVRLFGRVTSEGRHGRVVELPLDVLPFAPAPYDEGARRLLLERCRELDAAP